MGNLLYKPRPERWLTLRVSLKAVFALMTLLSVWLGVQSKWIRDRHEAVRDHRALDDIVRWRMGINRAFTQPDEHCQAPWSIRILGEPGAKTIFVESLHDPFKTYYERCEVEKQRLARLFPEAEVIERSVFLIERDESMHRSPH